MVLMPWVRVIVALEEPTAQKACRGYRLDVAILKIRAAFWTAAAQLPLSARPHTLNFPSTPRERRELLLPQSKRELLLPQSRQELLLPQSKRELLLPQSRRELLLPQSKRELLLPQSKRQLRGRSPKRSAPFHAQWWVCGPVLSRQVAPARF